MERVAQLTRWGFRETWTFPNVGHSDGCTGRGCFGLSVLDSLIFASVCPQGVHHPQLFLNAHIITGYFRLEIGECV